MSSTSQLTTFSDLYTDLLQRMRLNTSVAASVEQAKRYINIALHDMHLGFDYKFPWCERQTYLQTKAPYSTGTVTIAKGASSITGTGTAWNTANAFGVTNAVASGKFKIEGINTIYKISAISGDTSATLWQRFQEESVTGATYEYFEDEVSLGTAYLRPIDLTMFSPAMGIQLISRAEFRRRYPVVNVKGKPKVACIIDTVSSGTNFTPIRSAVFYPYPDAAYSIPISYISANLAISAAGVAATSLSADTDVPIVPLRYRHAIIYHAMYHWYRDKKDDGRAESAKSEYVDIVTRIVGDHDIATHTKAQLQPNVGSYHRSAYAPYSGVGGRLVYDLNDDFDQFRR